MKMILSPPSNAPVPGLTSPTHPQLHRRADRAQAASRDGLQWEGRERGPVPVPGHGRPGGGLQRPGGPRPQGRGKELVWAQPPHL